MPLPQTPQARADELLQQQSKREAAALQDLAGRLVEAMRNNPRGPATEQLRSDLKRQTEFVKALNDRLKQMIGRNNLLREKPAAGNVR